MAWLPVTPDPHSPREVAVWAMRQVSREDGERWLWVRWVSGGPGWWLTSSERPPRGGIGWRLVARIPVETARGGLVGWASLASCVADALSVA